jgi:hypothetical protein
VTRMCRLSSGVSLLTGIFEQPLEPVFGASFFFFFLNNLLGPVFRAF